MVTKVTDRKLVAVPSTIGAGRKGQLASAWTKYRKRYGPHLTPKQAQVVRKQLRDALDLLKEAVTGKVGWTDRVKEFLKSV